MFQLSSFYCMCFLGPYELTGPGLGLNSVMSLQGGPLRKGSRFLSTPFIRLMDKILHDPL